ncbi:MAG: hypothetical protein H7144_03020 [Burkholderiales bacterium]|nr:hypothetical protein [Phycisphaerae bacterium]
MLDQLERRFMLSTVSIGQGKLRIEGTANNDAIRVARFSKTQGQVTEGATVLFTFQLREIIGISFNGRAGNDSIELGRINIKSFLVGGSGDDSLSASRGDARDTIFGGDGSDYLFGGGANDSLDGGLLDDTMLGDSGDDTIIVLSSLGNDDFISGGAGTDIVDGSAYPTKVTWEVGNGNPNGLNVNDTIAGDVENIIGTAFNDTIKVLSGRSVRVDGGAGNDTITTGSGNDTVIGGAGRDSISTAGGVDTFFTNDGEIDTLTGGTGVDSATADADDVLNSVSSS